MKMTSVRNLFLGLAREFMNEQARPVLLPRFKNEDGDEGDGIVVSIPDSDWDQVYVRVPGKEPIYVGITGIKVENDDPRRMDIVECPAHLSWDITDELSSVEVLFFARWLLGPVGDED